MTSFVHSYRMNDTRKRHKLPVLMSVLAYHKTKKTSILLTVNCKDFQGSTMQQPQDVVSGLFEYKLPIPVTNHHQEGYSREEVVQLIRISNRRYAKGHGPMLHPYRCRSRTAQRQPDRSTIFRFYCFAWRSSKSTLSLFLGALMNSDVTRTKDKFAN
jgi:hypothetical protein